MAFNKHRLVVFYNTMYGCLHKNKIKILVALHILGFFCWKSTKAIVTKYILMYISAAYGNNANIGPYSLH